MRRRRRWIHSVEIKVSTSESWLGSAGRKWRRNAAVRASSSAGSSPGMMWDQASMPDLRALRDEAALPSGDVGPVDFWALRRLALIWAWVGMGESQLTANTGAAASTEDGGGCY